MQLCKDCIDNGHYIELITEKWEKLKQKHENDKTFGSWGQFVEELRYNVGKCDCKCH